jgi:hypothetical protein
MLTRHERRATGWASGVRSAVGAKDFSLLHVVQTASGPSQPPGQWVPGALSTVVKLPEGRKLTTHPHLVPRSRTVEL